MTRAETAIEDTPMTLHRRTFLRAAGVALALPCLDAFALPGGRAADTRRRMLCICTRLSVEVDKFSSGTGTLRGLELVGA